MTTKAKSLSVILVVLVAPWGVATLGLASRASRSGQANSVNAEPEMDGAYRDGLFLGELDARQGRSMKPSIGRWNTEKDRNSFKAGYEKGYREVMTSESSQPRR